MPMGDPRSFVLWENSVLRLAVSPRPPVQPFARLLPHCDLPRPGRDRALARPPPRQLRQARFWIPRCCRTLASSSGPYSVCGHVTDTVWHMLCDVWRLRSLAPGLCKGLLLPHGSCLPPARPPARPPALLLMAADPQNFDQSFLVTGLLPLHCVQRHH